MSQFTSNYIQAPLSATLSHNPLAVGSRPSVPSVPSEPSGLQHGGSDIIHHADFREIACAAAHTLFRIGQERMKDSGLSQGAASCSHNELLVSAGESAEETNHPTLHLCVRAGDEFQCSTFDSRLALRDLSLHRDRLQLFSRAEAHMSEHRVPCSDSAPPLVRLSNHRTLLQEPSTHHPSK
ncbi:unnamed protein product, partial [Pleuronectes platessa]